MPDEIHSQIISSQRTRIFMPRLPLFFPLKELLENVNYQKFGREMMKFYKSLSDVVIGMATQSVDGTSRDQPNLRHNQLSVYF